MQKVRKKQSFRSCILKKKKLKLVENPTKFENVAPVPIGAVKDLESSEWVTKTALVFCLWS